jgi:hypothetical protein
VQHHRGLELAVHSGRDRHRIARKIVQKIGRAVERVHDPDQSVPHHFRGELLADDPASGLRSQQHVRDDPFGGAVHLGHEIPGALAGPAPRVCRPLDASEIAPGPIGGEPCEMK